MPYRAFFCAALIAYVVVHVLDELVAGAGGGLEASSIEDLDLAAGDAVARLTTNIRPLV